MRKSFSTGIAILLPVIITSVIISWLIEFLTHPFLSLADSFLTRLNLFNSPSLISESSILIASSQAFILFCLMAFTLLIGAIGKLFLIDSILKLGNALFLHVPYINRIYKACQDVVYSLFSSKSKSFSHVVLVPYPSKANLIIGLVSQIPLTTSTPELGKNQMVAVFVPGTPNPSAGYTLKFRKEDILFIDMRVEEAMKFVISCGIVMPNFKIVQPPI